MLLPNLRVQEMASKAELIVVLNWGEELKRLVPTRPPRN